MSKLTLENLKDKKVVSFPAKKLTALMEDIILLAKEVLEKDTLSPDEMISFCCSHVFEELEDVYDYCEQIFLVESDNQSTYSKLSYKYNTVVFDEYSYSEKDNELNWFATCELSLKKNSQAEVSWYYSDSFTEYLSEYNEEVIYQVTTMIKLANLLTLDVMVKEHLD